MPKYSSLEDCRAQICARAAVDARYRQWLLADPRAALEEQLGASAKSVNVRFVAKSPDVDALIVLPDAAQGDVAAAVSTSDDALARVANRAATDSAYRERLLRAPREAIEEELGTTISAGIKVRFIEKDPGLDALVVLPDFALDRQEIGPDDLKAVAGGDGTAWCSATCECTIGTCSCTVATDADEGDDDESGSAEDDSGNEDVSGEDEEDSGEEEESKDSPLGPETFCMVTGCGNTNH